MMRTMTTTTEDNEAPDDGGDDDHDDEDDDDDVQNGPITVALANVHPTGAGRTRLGRKES